MGNIEPDIYAKKISRISKICAVILLIYFVRAYLAEHGSIKITIPPVVIDYIYNHLPLINYFDDTILLPANIFIVFILIALKYAETKKNRIATIILIIFSLKHFIDIFHERPYSFGSNKIFFIYVCFSIYLTMLIFKYNVAKHTQEALNVPENLVSQTEQLPYLESYSQRLVEISRELEDDELIADVLAIAENMSNMPENTKYKKVCSKYCEELTEILEKYDQIENMKLTQKEFTDMMSKIKSATKSFRATFEEILSEAYSNELINVEAKITAVLIDMKLRGYK